MGIKSTDSRYGKVAVTLHWLTALLIFALLASGFQAGAAPESTAKSAFLRLHVPLGATILLLTLTRIGWWLFADTKPASIQMPSWQDRASRAVHTLFYIVILGMAASGIGMIVLSGAGPIIFGIERSALPDFWDYLPRRPHGLGARLMVALVVFHVGAALYHQFIM